MLYRLRAKAFFAMLSLSLMMTPAANARNSCDIRLVTLKLEKEADRLVARPDMPGVSVALGDQRSVWADGFGFASVELDVRMSPKTRLRVGSVSKVFTTAALLRLVQTGKIDLDAKVSKYLPNYPEPGRDATIRQLASHMGGIRHVVAADAHFGVLQTWDNAIVRGFDSVEASLEIVKDDDVIAPPGERYHYSSYAWNIISAVIEKAGGKDFLEQMRDDVFTPLNMTKSGPDIAKAIIPDRASFYEVEEPGKLQPAAPINMSGIWAAGGFLSTPTDMVRFAQAHQAGGYLNQATLETMWTLQKPRTGPFEYGIGWSLDMRDFIENSLIDTNVAREKALRNILARMPKIAYHTGSSRGGFALLIHAPKTNVAMAYVANVNGNIDEPYVDLFIAAMEAFLDLNDRASRCAR
jgi:serine beta-lactamase-like protein LACTB, mitochondrial